MSPAGTVIRMPARTAYCCACGRPFRPARPWHHACRTCWGWHRALSHLAAASRLIREVRA